MIYLEIVKSLENFFCFVISPLTNHKATFLFIWPALWSMLINWRHAHHLMVKGANCQVEFVVLLSNSICFYFCFLFFLCLKAICFVLMSKFHLYSLIPLPIAPCLPALSLCAVCFTFQLRNAFRFVVDCPVGYARILGILDSDRTIQWWKSTNQPH